MNRAILNLQLIIFALFLLIALSPLHAEYFRWVDDEGTIHYSDSMPPSQSQRKQDKLNESGRVVETIQAPKTVGELQEEARLVKLEKEQKRIQEEAEKHDRMLVAMYTSVEDIEFVRNERISTVDSAIEITKHRKSKFIKKLKDLDASEERFKASGKEAPPWLLKSRAHYQEQLSYADKIIEIKLKEKEGINKRFARDINRFLELKETGSTIQ